MKKNLAIAVLAVLAVLAVACSKPTSGSKQLTQDQQTAGSQQSIYTGSQPVELYDFSQERETLLAIYRARAKTVSTWSVFLSAQGVPLTSCPSIGYPIPATTQLTNPDQLVRVNVGNGNYVDGVLSQAEPTGVYAPSDTEATYVVCLRSNGSNAIVYSEPPVMTFSYEVRVVDGRIVDSGGTSTVEVSTKK